MILTISKVCFLRVLRSETIRLFLLRYSLRNMNLRDDTCEVALDIFNTIVISIWTIPCVATYISKEKCMLNTLRPRRNARYFAYDIFKCIFLNWNTWIPIKISLKFVPQGPINNILALVQIMAWRRPGDKPLSWPMMVRLPTHIYVTRPQWVNAKLTFMPMMNTQYWSIDTCAGHVLDIIGINMTFKHRLAYMI